jgi:hypothetical protein
LLKYGNRYAWLIASGVDRVGRDLNDASVEIQVKEEVLLLLVLFQLTAVSDQCVHR